VPAHVPFNLPPVTNREIAYLTDAIERRELSGNGHYTKLCSEWLRHRLGVSDALLTQSCTSALEMAALLCDLGPGDEVIMPSFTFVSTANAVVLRGAIPVFIDVRGDTLNIDETKIEAAITPRTKAIYVVHYAGVSCEMDAINAVARTHNLLVVEDAAQALLSTYNGVPAGRLGDIACFSFHATKNVTSGEGGALVTNRPDIADRANIIWEKGTNRHRFLKGQVDKYTWVDVGSSFLPSELTAAFLLAQLEGADEFTKQRRAVWMRYHSAFANLEAAGVVTRPSIPKNVTHNAHMYYLLVQNAGEREQIIAALKASGVETPFHYVPLHSSPAGQRFGRATAEMTVTDDLSARLIRLPMWAGMEDAVARVIETVQATLKLQSGAKV
jgi:dTDP-4-amino-4,6-dideoxygalactose transaminase